MSQNNLHQLLKERSVYLFEEIEKINTSFEKLYNIEISDELEKRMLFKSKFDEEYLVIENGLNIIVEELNFVRSKCYEDFPYFIKMLGLSQFDKDEAIQIVKDSRIAIGILNEYKYENKKEIANSITENEHIRFFIHQVMNILSIAKPFFIKKVLDKELAENKIIKDSSFLLEKLKINENQINKLKKGLISLNNMTYNDINKSSFNTSELIKYIDLYIENRVNDFQYEDKIFHIETSFYNENFDVISNLLKIEEIIDVLLNNACEELSNKEIENKPFVKKIDIELKKDGMFMLISVKDNGRGIVNTESIFEPYFTTKSSSGGSGIGLTAVSQLIKILNGFIEVKTNKKNGSEFIVKIPIR